MNAVAIYLLLNNELPTSKEQVTKYNLFCIGYHTLATVPVALQSVIGLMRTVMALTKKRERDQVTQEVFFHLLYKEFFRSVIVGGLACSCLGLLPIMVWDTQMKVAAGLLGIFAYSLSNAIYSFSCFAAVRVLRMTSGGVVVPMLDRGRKGRGGGRGGEGRGGEGRSASKGPERRARSKSAPRKGKKD
jgi:hypothetical protein